MKLQGTLKLLPGGVRYFLVTFVLVLSVGFYTGISFVGNTTGNTPDGIEANYLGNEEDEDADIMIFKKSEREIYTLIHTHILSLSVIFLILGVLVWMTDLPGNLRGFLSIEPLISLLITFGGIYALWKGVIWFRYIIMVSGILMTLTYTLAVFLIIRDLLLVHPQSTSNSSS